jgi:hypothetical protein
MLAGAKDEELFGRARGEPGMAKVNSPPRAVTTYHLDCSEPFFRYSNQYNQPCHSGRHGCDARVWLEIKPDVIIKLSRSIQGHGKGPDIPSLPSIKAQVNQLRSTVTKPSPM